MVHFNYSKADFHRAGILGNALSIKAARETKPIFSSFGCDVTFDQDPLEAVHTLDCSGLDLCSCNLVFPLFRVLIGLGVPAGSNLPRDFTWGANYRVTFIFSWRHI